MAAAHKDLVGPTSRTSSPKSSTSKPTTAASIHLSCDRLNDRVHRFAIAGNLLVADEDDHELIAELVGGNSGCLVTAERAVAAVIHGLDVSARRALPHVQLEVIESSKPHPLVFWTREPTGPCCRNYQSISTFVPTVRHTLSAQHLAAQFHTSAAAIYTVQAQLGAPGSWDSAARPSATENINLSDVMLDLLWGYGIDVSGTGLTGPWAMDGFPEHLAVACELARAYTQPSLKRALDVKKLAEKEPLNPAELANLMLGREPGLDFDVDFKHRLISPSPGAR